MWRMCDGDFGTSSTLKAVGQDLRFPQMWHLAPRCDLVRWHDKELRPQPLGLYSPSQPHLTPTSFTLALQPVPFMVQPQVCSCLLPGDLLSPYLKQPPTFQVSLNINFSSFSTTLTFSKLACSNYLKGNHNKNGSDACSCHSAGLNKPSVATWL